MAEIKIINIKTLKSDSESFDGSILDSDRGEKCVPYVVNWQLAGRRSGTANTKLMSEISGTTAKPYKQKGTGRARQGSLRSVQFRGGRTCFGPLTRDFSYTMPKKIVKQALAFVLRNKIKEGKLLLVEGLEDFEISTKNLDKALKNFEINKALVACENMTDNDGFLKSLRNIKHFKALPGSALNVYDIINHDFLLIERKAFDNVKEVMTKWA